MTAAAPTQAHVQRVRYRTDAQAGDTERFPGVLSGTFTLRDGAIVAVDWSDPGVVWITYLIEGPAPGGRR